MLPRVARLMIHSEPGDILSFTTRLSSHLGVTDPDLTNNSATDSDALVLSANLKVTVTEERRSARLNYSHPKTIVAVYYLMSRVSGTVVGDRFLAVPTRCIFTSPTTVGGSV